MPKAIAKTSDDELLLQWKQRVIDGAQTSPASANGDRGELDDPLQLLINAYIDDKAGAVDATVNEDTPAPTELDEPIAIPGFTFLGPLGGGGMGVVFRVRDQLDREWALKRVRRAQLSKTGRERFLEEARAMSRLDHPHVVPVHSLNEHAGIPYFLMPIYPTNLANHLSDYQHDPVRAVRLMAKVASGMGHLHEKGFVHRDLKPHNILIADNGQPAVSDFGLVKVMAETADETAPEPGSAHASGETRPTGARKSQTVAGVVVGTRAYMAPQQAAGMINLANPKWDVWSFGVVLHELLTGHRPLSSDDPAQLLNPGSRNDPPPSTYKPEIDPKLERIVCKCLARDEGQRYANGQEVAEELAAWVRDKTRRPRWRILVSILLVITCAVVAVLAIKPKKPDLPTDPRADLLARLAKHEQVELIPGNGRPKYFQVLAARPGTNPIDDAAEFTVNTQEPILIELVPAEANLSGFHLSGEVQFIALPNWTARAGLYVNHHFDGPDHIFVDWTFSETNPPSVSVKPNEMIGNFKLSVSHLTNAGSGRKALSPIPTTTSKPFTYDWPGPNNPLPSRTLGLRVSGRVFEPEWQKAQAGLQPATQLDKGWNMAYPGHPRPAAGPAGGIGLYITQGTAVFRNVILEPNP